MSAGSDSASPGPGGLEPDPTGASLCGGCRSLRRLRSARGSVFYLCERAQQDLRFERYPPQPVVACVGFEAAPAAGGGPESG